LCISAIVGDTVGYWIGLRAGPRLFQKEKSFFFRKDYLQMAQDFYTEHGGKTIIIARFVPIIRTFAPVVAGIGQMPYRRFLSFNVIGGISWITSMMALGYTLHLWAEPLVNTITGWLGIKKQFKVERNIDLIVIVIVLISILPIVWKGFRSYQAKRRSVRMAQSQPPAAT
jgi:membrane-associated protein